MKEYEHFDDNINNNNTTGSFNCISKNEFDLLIKATLICSFVLVILTIFYIIKKTSLYNLFKKNYLNSVDLDNDNAEKVGDFFNISKDKFFDRMFLVDKIFIYSMLFVNVFNIVCYTISLVQHDNKLINTTTQNNCIDLFGYSTNFKLFLEINIGLLSFSTILILITFLSSLQYNIKIGLLILSALLSFGSSFPLFKYIINL